MKIIIFANQKGGVGKTTLAMLTAIELSKRMESVLVLDTDPQKNLMRRLPEMDNVIVDDKPDSIYALLDVAESVDDKTAVIVDTIGALSFDNPATTIISRCAEKQVSCKVVVPYNVSYFSADTSLPFMGTLTTLFKHYESIGIHAVANNVKTGDVLSKEFQQALTTTGIKTLPTVNAYLDIARLRFLDKCENPKAQENINTFLTALLE